MNDDTNLAIKKLVCEDFACSTAVSSLTSSVFLVHEFITVSKID